MVDDTQWLSHHAYEEIAALITTSPRLLFILTCRSDHLTSHQLKPGMFLQAEYDKLLTTPNLVHIEMKPVNIHEAVKYAQSATSRRDSLQIGPQSATSRRDFAQVHVHAARREQPAVDGDGGVEEALD